MSILFTMTSCMLSKPLRDLNNFRIKMATTEQQHRIPTCEFYSSSFRQGSCKFVVTIKIGQTFHGKSWGKAVGTFRSCGSWRDTQIYLAAASSGKSVPTCYAIADFVSSSVEEEIVVGSNGSHQVVLKSGPKKPKLENITFAQWSVANLAILYKLVEDVTQLHKYVRLFILHH